MKKNKKLYLTIGFILISIPLLCASPLIKSSQNNKNEAAGYTKDIAELTRIVDVINIIENRFVGKEATPSKEELYKASITGIINKLDDPYSEYLSTEDLKEFSEDLEGEYVGVGMAVQKKKGEPMEVTSPFVGSPAEKVGIRIKDKIIKVDGKDILPLTATETTKMLQGKENTKVEREIPREGQNNPIKFTVTRAKIKLEMVELIFLNKINNIILKILISFI